MAHRRRKVVERAIRDKQRKDRIHQQRLLRLAERKAAEKEAEKVTTDE